jgi:hypothetical protein
MHHIDRQSAQAAVGRELRALGWKLWGWTDDKSDPMTDYFEPDHWWGVATLEHGGELLISCVDVSGYTVKTRSGYTEEVREWRTVGPCPRCQGRGDDPEIPFTIGEARENPEEYHAAYSAVHCPGSVPLFKNTVSPLQFTSDGKAKCAACSGSGHEKTLDIFEGPKWPEFHRTPKGKTWHVERGGAVVTSGVGLSRANHSQEEARQLAERIHRAATVAQDVATGEGVCMRRNEERNGVEVRFPAKPPEAVRLQLKAAGFRWSRRGGCWYNKATPDAVEFAERLVDGISPTA